MKCNTSFKIVSEWKTIKKSTTTSDVVQVPLPQPFSRSSSSFPQLRTPREPRLPPALHLRLDSDASASAAPAYRSPLAVSAPAPSRVLVLQHWSCSSAPLYTQASVGGKGQRLALPPTPASGEH